MNELKKFALWLLILLLFIGCNTVISSKTERTDSQETENAFLEGNWDELITYGEKRLTEEPDNIVVRYILSMAYYMKGEYELQEHQRSLALEDEKSIDAIVAWCEQLAQRFPNNYYAYFLLGSAYRAKDDVNNAMESYKRAIEINPNFGDAYMGLGAIYFANWQIEEAMKFFKKVIEINPKHIAAHFNLGVMYENNGQIDEAIAMYEKTIEMNPGFKDAYRYIGHLYLVKGERDKAIKVYEKVIELDSESELGIYAKEVIESLKRDLDKDIEKKP